MKKKIIDLITVFMAGVWVVGASALDSQNITIPLIMCIVSSVWWAGFIYANRDAELDEVLW